MKTISNTFYTYRHADGEIFAVNHVGLDENQLSTFFRDLSYRIAFDDCSGETVLDIYVEGEKIEYKGWQPGMLYEYVDTKGKTVWSASFPHWDH